MSRKIPSLPHPSSPLTDDQGRMSHEWYDKLDELQKALLNRIPVTGSATFAGITTASVAFTTPESDASYSVWFSAPDSKTYWATSKTTASFTANASSALTGTVVWQLIRS